MNRTRLFAGFLFLMALASSCKDSTVSPEEHKCTEVLTDIDGNEYRTVQIGEQCWMAENLRVLHYPDGTPVEKGQSDSNLDRDTNPRFYYKYDTWLQFYGPLYELLAESTILYTWGAAVKYEGSGVPDGEVQGICPDGWHVPSKSDWDDLISFLGEETAAQQLKSTDTLHWSQSFPGIYGTDDYGFTSIASGGRDAIGAWYLLDQHAYYWSSTEFEEETWRIWTPYIVHWSNSVQWLGYSKSNSFCVRCVKNR